MRRDELEQLAVRLLNGWPGGGPIGLASDRELLLAMLRKLSPNFAASAHSDDALETALSFALSREDHVASMLTSAEQKRQTAWQPNVRSLPPEGVDAGWKPAS
jgi:hypothetical protein